MAAAGGNPRWLWSKKLHCSDVGQWQPQGPDSFLARDWLPNLRLPVRGPLRLAEEEMRRRRWLRHRSLVLASAARLDFERPE